MTPFPAFSPVAEPLASFAGAPPALDRPVKVHCCRDGTISWRRAGEPVFNGRALPVASVETEAEAHALAVLMGFRCYGDHPQMRGALPWYKFNDVRHSGHHDGDVPVFDVDQLLALGAKIEAVYRAHIQTPGGAR